MWCSNQNFSNQFLATGGTSIASSSSISLLPVKHAHPDLVAKIQPEEDRDRDVGGKEVGCTPIAGEEYLEAVRQGQDGNQEQRELRCIWLQRRSEWQHIHHAIKRHGLPKPQRWQPNNHVAITAAHGTPFFVVEEKNFGACLFNAIEYSTREPEYRNAFPADQADVRIAALMMDDDTDGERSQPVEDSETPHVSSGEVMNAKPARTKAVQYAKKRPVDPSTRYGLKAPGLLGSHYTDKLDTRKPKFRFTEYVDRDDVQEQDDDQDDCDPDGDRHRSCPVLQHDGACCHFGSYKNGISIPIVLITYDTGANEETGSDGATKGQKLNVTTLQATLGDGIVRLLERSFLDHAAAAHGHGCSREAELSRSGRALDVAK
ncbi:hypothetical protein KC329_g95 [Hortaea werneckii]|nr:hypothetical protein KC329_g95 [Hortaea werneckii]